MLSLSLSEEDVRYLSSLLEKEGRRLELRPNNEALIKINSGLHEILSSRVSQYMCYMEELESGDQYNLTFADFQKYYGKLPTYWDENQIMSHIIEWSKQNGFKVNFRRI